MTGALTTYSSSRCRCDSTMMMGQCRRGREGSVGKKKNLVQLLRSPQSGDELCWSKQHGRGWVVYSNGGLVGFIQTKTQSERRGMQESSPRPADSRDERSGEPADQSPVKSTLHLERREKGKVSIRYAWQITWRVGGDEIVYSLGVLHQCFAPVYKMVGETPNNNRKGKE